MNFNMPIYQKPRGSVGQRSLGTANPLNSMRTRNRKVLDKLATPITKIRNINASTTINDSILNSVQIPQPSNKHQRKQNPTARYTNLDSKVSTMDDGSAVNAYGPAHIRTENQMTCSQTDQTNHDI